VQNGDPADNQSGASTRHFERSHKMNISDVMIHINESLNVEARTSLEEAMRQIEGVVAPRFSPGKEHLLVVAYNPEETSTAALLEKARAAGYTAQLIGA
jgi:hypothetical protein